MVATVWDLGRSPTRSTRAAPKGLRTLTPGEITANLDVTQDRDVELATAVDAETILEGTATANAIVSRYEDEPYKAYELTEHVKAIVDRFGATHRFAGHFQCEGEEPGDMWRVRVRDNQVTVVRPHLIWPDDETHA